MSKLRVVPIVEGHGEQEAIPTLLKRVWKELLGGELIDVLPPIRHPRSQLVQKSQLQRAIELARLKLRSRGPAGIPGLVLVLVDADEDEPCQLGPQLLRHAGEGTDLDIACVVAKIEYETWFVAAAESLSQYLEVKAGEAPQDPEDQRCRKTWIEKRIKAPKYSETVDQPAMTAAMDLALCRSRSPSFDKLCRELERRLATSR